MVFIAYKLVLAVSVWKENAALKKKKKRGWKLQINFNQSFRPPTWIKFNLHSRTRKSSLTDGVSQIGMINLV